MDRHLVAVEVGIEGLADQGVYLKGIPVNQHGLEGLNAEAMQRRSTVQQHRAFLDHIIERIPDLRAISLNQAPGALQVIGIAIRHQLVHDHGLQQFQGNVARQATLVKLQLRPDYNHRTAAVVYALTKKVLPEPPLLAL